MHELNRLARILLCAAAVVVAVVGERGVDEKRAPALESSDGE